MRVWPVRTCVACRRQRPCNELLRVAMTGDGPRLDVRRRLGGRGCHVCPTPECVDQATSRDHRVIRRALRCENTDDMSPVLASLRAHIHARSSQEHSR